MKYVIGTPPLEGKADPNDLVEISVRTSPYFADQSHLYVVVNGIIMLRIQAIKRAIILCRRDGTLEEVR